MSKAKTTTAADSSTTAEEKNGNGNLPATANAGSNFPVASSEFEGALTEFSDMGSGLENVTSKDILIPRLTILQALSPQIDPQAPEFDEDARAGNIYDVGLQESFGNLITIIPVHYAKTWLQWAPRSSGKGLQGIHDNGAILDKCGKDEKGRPVLDNGDLIVETAQFYVLNMNANLRKSFIPMASTQLKKSKRLLTLATSERLVNSAGNEFVPPLFYRTYDLGTIPESNNEGRWIGWTVERAAALDQLPNWRRIMEEIKNFRDALTKGELKADIESMAKDAAGGGGDSGGEHGRM